MRSTCHIVSHDGWIARTIRQALPSDTAWDLVRHDGLAPTRDLGDNDALWIDPGLLIAQNAWLESLGRLPMTLMAPPADCLGGLGESLLGRRVMVACAGEVRQWRHPPAGLGNRPWSQIAGGRVPAFRAARRTLSQLRQDLAEAPDDARIQISRHIDDIDQEWRVVVLGGRAVASSGYCRHIGSDDHDIITVFDGASFDPNLRAPAEETAVHAAALGGMDAVCIDLAFPASSSPNRAPELMHPFVLEVNPAWCCSPYDYGRAGMAGFLAAIAAGRRPEGTHLAGAAPYNPDPWMADQFRNRYRSYWGRA